jgi:hypothetical protein
VILRLHAILERAVVPALTLLGKHMDSPAARVMLLAIGMQESRFEHRYQVVGGRQAAIAALHGEIAKGPARGFWQFEKGGVRGVWRHHASAESLRLLCQARDCPFDPVPIWEQIELDDVLAAGVARLLLYTDPFPLPRPEQSDVAWLYYTRNWRPGKPHPKTWPDCHARAVEEVFPPPAMTPAQPMTEDDL